MVIQNRNICKYVEFECTTIMYQYGIIPGHYRTNDLVDTFAQRFLKVTILFFVQLFHYQVKNYESNCHTSTF